MEDQISGEINLTQKLTCVINQPRKVIGMFGKKSDGLIGTVTGTAPMEYYDGVYVVIPKAREETVLGTKNKAMEDDVTVVEIPYAEVGNLSGGMTVTIA